MTVPSTPRVSGEVVGVRVLVTYVSPHGSTRSIAARIAERLAGRGLSVDCCPVPEVRGLGDYDAVVVGSAIHDRAWMPEASDFVRARAAELGTTKVWLFSVGMTAALAPPLRRPASREGATVLAPIAGAVRPRGTQLFSGVAAREQFPAISRVALRLAGGRFGDFRSWPDIDAWAWEIADQLQVGATPGAAGASPSRAPKHRAGG